MKFLIAQSLMCSGERLNFFFRIRISFLLFVGCFIQHQLCSANKRSKGFYFASLLQPYSLRFCRICKSKRNTFASAECVNISNVFDVMFRGKTMECEKWPTSRYWAHDDFNWVADDHQVEAHFVSIDAVKNLLHIFLGLLSSRK